MFFTIVDPDFSFTSRDNVNSISFFDALIMLNASLLSGLLYLFIMGAPLKILQGQFHLQYLKKDLNQSYSLRRCEDLQEHFFYTLIEEYFQVRLLLILHFLQLQLQYPS